MLAGFTVVKPVLPVFPRYRKGSFIVSSAKIHNSRDSSICKVYVRSSTSLPGECFGSVKKLCFTDDSVPAAIVSVFEPTGEDVVPKPRYHSLLREDDEDDFKATKIFEVVYIQSQKVIYNK